MSSESHRVIAIDGPAASGKSSVALELARRLGETGAMNKLDQAREQVFYADVTAQLAASPHR